MIYSWKLELFKQYNWRTFINNSEFAKNTCAYSGTDYTFLVLFKLQASSGSSMMFRSKVVPFRSDTESPVILPLLEASTKVQYFEFCKWSLRFLSRWCHKISSPWVMPWVFETEESQTELEPRNKKGGERQSWSFWPEVPAKEKQSE
jgi:hypothetical protein